MSHDQSILPLHTSVQVRENQMSFTGVPSEALNELFRQHSFGKVGPPELWLCVGGCQHWGQINNKTARWNILKDVSAMYKTNRANADYKTRKFASQNSYMLSSNDLNIKILKRFRNWYELKRTSNLNMMNY